MSDPGSPRANEEQDSDEMPSKGPNLTLIYSLIVLALIAATVIAAVIVLPFYQRR
jgi:hypothetical protein